MYQYRYELNKFRGISLEIDKIVNDANQKLEEKEKQITRLWQDKKVLEKGKEMENIQLTLLAGSINDLYLNMIDSLLVEREKTKAINNKIELLEDVIVNLNTRLGYASLLQADNLKVIPVKVSGGGKGQC